MSGETSRINGRMGGRPRGSETELTKIRREMKKRWVFRVQRDADRIFEAHMDLALGCYVEQDTPEGLKRVYKAPPNRQSLEWIMDHIWGKAQSLEEDYNEDEAHVASLSEEQRYAVVNTLQKWGLVKLDVNS